MTTRFLIEVPPERLFYVYIANLAAKQVNIPELSIVAINSNFSYVLHYPATVNHEGWVQNR